MWETDKPLTAQRPDMPEPAQQPARSGIGTILFHVHDDESLSSRLEAALSVARACGAHLHCLHVTPIEAYTVVDVFGATFVNQEVVSAFEEQAADIRQRIEARLAREDVAWDYEEITGELVPHLIGTAALADLLVTGREPQRREFGGPPVALLGDLIEQARTPILICGDEPDSFDPFGPAVIAWDGSYEAAIAVRGAVPLLKMAGGVFVVQFSEKKDRRFPSTSLLEYLSRHGIKAHMEARATKRPVAEAIEHFADERQAGLIVMGGYGHSRAGEFLFGGVTRALLKRCRVSLLLGH